jgi:hypothetical protein
MPKHYSNTHSTAHKGLTPKQKKLPVPLQKAILRKMKMNK